MTSPQPYPIEILDLRHFTGRQLKPLLETAAAAWQHRLRWDYRSSTDLLLSYLDSRILPGFVALDRGRICGYTFCVYEGRKSVLGDLYVDHAHPAPLALTHTLARHLLEVLEASPEIERIEAQLLLYDSGVLPPALPRFRVFPRLFLECVLSGPVPVATLPAEVEMTPWASGCYDAAAALIQSCYVGHIDSDINDQYRTLSGSLRFLHNVIRFPGCGTFDPAASWVLRLRDGGDLLGVLLCSRVDADVAHVTQLCVLPGWRGRRLGHALLQTALGSLFQRGCQALTLTVSEDNRSAVDFYRAAGFRTRHRFDALVFDKPPRRFL